MKKQKPLILRFHQIPDQEAMDNLIKDLEVAMETKVDIISSKQIRKTKEERAKEREERKERKEKEALEGKKRKRISKDDPEKEQKKKAKLNLYSNKLEVKGRKMLLSKCRRQMLSDPENGLKVKYPIIYNELYSFFVPPLDRPVKEKKEPSKKRKRVARTGESTGNHGMTKKKRSKKTLQHTEELIPEAELEKNKDEELPSTQEMETDELCPKKKPRTLPLVDTTA